MLIASRVECVGSRLYVFAFECVCSRFRDVGSSLDTGESVNSVTDGSLEEGETPLVTNQAPSHLIRYSFLAFP